MHQITRIFKKIKQDQLQEGQQKLKFSILGFFFDVIILAINNAIGARRKTVNLLSC
jgi:hypothetical protein